MFSILHLQPVTYLTGQLKVEYIMFLEIDQNYGIPSAPKYLGKWL